MQIGKRRLSKVGVFLLGLFGALVGAFVLAPSVSALGEHYQYIPASDTIKVSGGVIETPVELRRTGSDSFEGNIRMIGSASRMRDGNAATLGRPCIYTLQVTGIEGDLKVPGDGENQGHNASVDLDNNDTGAGDETGDMGCKVGEVLTPGPGQDYAIDQLTQDVNIVNTPDARGNAGGNACPGSDAPAGTNCANIPAGCPGSTQQAPSGGGTPENCPHRAVAANDEAASDDPCPIEKNTSLRWLFCPLTELGITFANGLDKFITMYMTTGNDVFNDTNGSYRKAWETFRTFGISLVIIAGLIMVISEALNLEWVDAYTIRKVLPRLVIAVIGITISWEMMRFLVGFFDALGHGAGSIIQTSFGQTPRQQELGSVLVEWLAIIGGTAIGAYRAIFVLGATGVISLLGTIGLAILIGAIVLIVRQAIIIACILLAPLAIAAYILPNTNKFASFWWNTFFSMMILYPLATGLIALCKALGIITGNTDKFGAPIVGFLFFFAGYALLPAAFRLSGGLVATLGGIANDRGKGGFDRLRGVREAAKEKNRADTEGENRFSGSGAFTQRMNKLGARVQAGPRGWAPTSKARGIVNSNKVAYDAERIKNNKAMSAYQNDDSSYTQLAKFDSAKNARAAAKAKYDSEVLGAQMAYSNGQISSATRDQHIQDAQIGLGKSETAIQRAEAMGFNTGNRRAAIAQLGRMGYGFKSPNEVRRAIADVSQGDQSMYETMLNDFEYNSKGAGRYDLSRSGDASAPEHEQMWKRWTNADLYTHGKSKAASVEGFAKHFEKELTSGDEGRREKALQFFEEVKAMKNNSSGSTDVIDAALDRTASTRKSAMDSLSSTAFAPGGANAITVRDPSQAPVFNPATGNYERPVHSMRQETGKERVMRHARAYERPDPNRDN